jgi:hypothetical protein
MSGAIDWNNKDKRGEVPTLSKSWHVDPMREHQKKS